MRQFASEVGKANVLFIHMTLLPSLRAAGELKTKPTQQSVAKLREIGIQPDILICRTEQPITEEIREKLSLFCSVPKEAVIEEMDVAPPFTNFRMLKEGLDRLVTRFLGLDAPARSLTNGKKSCSACSTQNTKLESEWLANIWTFKILIFPSMNLWCMAVFEMIAALRSFILTRKTSNGMV